MKFLVTSCIVLFCLAHASHNARRKINPNSLVALTHDDDGSRFSFVGGGVMQDSCSGEMKFTSKLNHTSDSSLDKIRYEVRLADGTTKKFEGLWYWKATDGFMADYRWDHNINLNDPHEDMDLGEFGSDEAWQEECEERSTHISLCDRIYSWRNDPASKPNIILTGEGHPLNPAYYEITFNSKTEDGCKRQWTDRLVFHFHGNQPD